MQHRQIGNSVGSCLTRNGIEDGLVGFLSLLQGAFVRLSTLHLNVGSTETVSESETLPMTESDSTGLLVGGRQRKIEISHDAYKKLYIVGSL